LKTEPENTKQNSSTSVFEKQSEALVTTKMKLHGHHHSNTKRGIIHHDYFKFLGSM
jgi:hypothetical protein